MKLLGYKASLVLSAIAIVGLGIASTTTAKAASLQAVTGISTVFDNCYTSYVRSFKDSGQLLGSSKTVSGDSFVFVYSGDQMLYISALGSNSTADDFNNFGLVVGGSKTNAGLFNALRDRNTQMQDKGTFGGYFQKQRIESMGVGSRDALVVGNPTMPKVTPQIGEPPQQLPSLPGAEEEAKAIAKLLKTTALTGNHATKQAVLQKMSGARIVHLATHGLLDDIQGLGSAIALAPDPKPHIAKPGEINGLLTAEEILNLKLNAELVVLSACDTGRGRITGDGVVGLSRSLISAGVPSVLVSLWSVPDAPTAFLMTEFYRNLQKNPDKAQALRQAMLATMKQHPNPIDWAAFTLIGEAD